MEKVINNSAECYAVLADVLTEKNIQNLLLVCDNAFDFLCVKEDILRLQTICNIVKFDDFSPNPDYESVCKGVETFNQNSCTAILAIGGGSAIDVAKCIKLYANMDSQHNYLQQEIVENDITLIAIPTTAGTGSEATRYAVIYYKGEKQSVTHMSCIPKYVLLIPDLLKTLPLYQKKATMLDALCHSIESYWSVNSTDESKKLSQQALQMILANLQGYIDNDDKGNENMLIAANLAGKAINITQTTAGHALCYKLSSMFSVAHGHAAAWSMLYVWEFMLKNMDKVCDQRGSEYVAGVFGDIAKSIRHKTPAAAIKFLKNLLVVLDLEMKFDITQEQLETLANSVNVTRLKNNPVALTKQDVMDIYCDLFKKIS